MFESLSDRLSGIFEGLTKRGALSDKDVDTLYILSDGEPTTGTYGREAQADTFVAAVLDLIEKRGKKVRIHGFGFFLRGRGRAILVQLAEATGGTFKDL